MRRNESKNNFSRYSSLYHRVIVRRVMLGVVCLVIVGAATTLVVRLLSGERPTQLNDSSERQVATQQEGQPPISENNGGAVNRVGDESDVSNDAEQNKSALSPKNLAEQNDAELEDDNPNGALEFRRLQMQDEKGFIPPDGMQKARQHVARMKAAREERLKARQQAGLPTEGINGAGIEPGSWEALGPGNIGGRIRSIVIHPTEPNKMWVGGVSGGIWRTADSGASWQPVNDFQSNLAVTTIVMDPTNPSTMYAGTGEGFNNSSRFSSGNFESFIQGDGIFKTVDGGLIWNQLSLTDNANFNYVNRLAISLDGTRILAATNSGVWRSTNGGMVWDQRTNVAALDVDFLGTDFTRAVVGELGKARYTLNGGETWTDSTFSPPISSGPTLATNGRVELATHHQFIYQAFVYASVNQNGGEIYRSNDGGQSYTQYSTGANYLVSSSAGSIGWYTNIIWSNPQDPDNLIVGGVNLWRGTIDFGTGTTPLTQISDGLGTSAHSDHHVIVEHPGFNDSTNRIAFFGNDGGIFRCDDVSAAVIPMTNSISYVELNNTLGITQFYGATVHNLSGTVIGGTQDNGTIKFSGNTEGWTEMHGSDGGYVAVDQTVANYFYGEEQNLKVHRSTDGGTTSSLIDAGLLDSTSCLPNTTCSNFIAPLVLDPNDPNTLLAGGIRLWRSSDVKAPTPTWSSIKDPLPPDSNGNIPISAIAVSPITSTLILVGHNNGDIYRTLNGAAPWEKISKPNLPARMVTRIVIDINHSTNWYYATFGGFSGDNLWRSTDDGATWTDISGGVTGLPSVPVRTLAINPINPYFLYVGTEIGIFTSEDAGANWDVSQDGPANVSVDELFFRADNTLYAATHGRGIYRTSSPVTVPPQVTNASDSGVGSLRYAMTVTNTVTAAEKKILFNISGGGVHTIDVSSPLPAMSGVTIDGWSQAGTAYTGPPLIELNGVGAIAGGGGPVDGLIISGGSVVKGLAINRFSGSGIRIDAGGGNSISGCYIGTNAGGTAAAGNATGVFINNSPGNIIGRQTFAEERNVISGNQVGIVVVGPISSGNWIRGNYIGTDVTGTARVSNTDDGIRIANAFDNTIGGLEPLAGNIISGNGVNNFGADGIEITGASSTGNMILGNYIGLAANGNLALGNLGSGVRIENAPGTIIGGADAAARNVIADNRNQGGIALIGTGSSGTIIQGNYLGTNYLGAVAIPNNAYNVYVESASNTIGGIATGAGNVISGFDTTGGIGIFLFGFAGSTGNVIQGNYIGTNADATAALSRVGTAIELRGGSTGALIGGTSAAARNIISGNFTAINDFVSNTIIQGNYIGTNPAGTAAVPNQRGIFVDGGSNHTIGGTSAGAGNVISGNGNGGHAINMTNTSGSFVQNNRIGTNAAGTAALGNGLGSGGHGVQVFNSTNVLIGGATAAARNVISANGGNGINISGGGGNIVRGNYIGTDAAGIANFGNGQSTGSSGIQIEAGSHTIGGTAPGDGNIIAFSGCFCFGSNFGSGIRVFGTGNRINGNSIHSNAEIGIDLVGGTETLRVTANDNCDADTGPNNLQNFPVLSSATSSGTSVTLAGSLNGAASTTFRIEIFADTTCDGSGNGEGQTYLGFTNVTTDASCNAIFNITFSASVPVGRFITATATDPSNNTSEFSGCVPVACGYAVSPASQFFQMNGGSGSINLLAGGSACAWSALASDDWITITSADSGSGSDTITFEVRENFTASARQGTINIAGVNHAIVQDGGLGEDCGYSISPFFESFAAVGGGGTIQVIAAERCAWQAVSSVSWVTITSVSVGIGNGAVNYSVGANPGSGRKGTITIGGQQFAVKQKGN